MSDDFVFDLSGDLADVIGQLTRRMQDMSPAYQAIGEVVTESTKQRFATSTGPDGTPWAPLAESTVLARLQRISGAYTKGSGRLSKKGATAAMSMRPLVDSGLTMDSIHYQLVQNGVEIGTNRFDAEWDGGMAVHQFGSRSGKIPARPFLGISHDDEIEVIDILTDYVRQISGAENA